MRILFFCVMCLFVLISCGEQSKEKKAANASAGEQLSRGMNLFQQNCASCHAVKIDLVGPALAGVTQRWSDKQKLYSFVRNAPAMIKEDAYAKQLWEKYNRTEMLPFPNLADADIDAILAYIESQNK